MDDLKRRMEQLAERGEPRGAARVLAAARRGPSTTATRTRFIVPIAIAACVLLVAGIAAAVVAPSDDDTQQVAGPTTTEPTTTTTEATPTTAAAAPTTTPPPTVPRGVVAASRLQPFRSWNAYLSYVKTKGVATVGAYGLPALGRGPMAFQRMAAAEGGGQVLAQGVQPSMDAFSTTNTQEEGIDEPDTAKSDGRTIFVLDDKSVLRTLSGTGTLRQLGSLSVPAMNQMLLVGERVILLGGHYDDARRTSYADIAVVDVSRPNAPRLASRLEVEGSVVSARLVGGAPRIVLRGDDPSQRLGFVYPSEPTEEAAAQATAQHRDRIAASDVGAWVPGWIMREGPKRGRTGRLVDYDHIYRPPTFAGFGLLTVMTLNVDDPSASDASSVVADGQIVYGSTSRLYIASTGWGPLSPLLQVEPAPETLVHSFDITAPDQASYRVSGKVAGTIKDQFSLSEYQDVLRVVTTAGNGEAAETSVRTLADQGQILTEIGSVGGLGRNEQVHGVRFIGPVGYVVTFRQVDPLYVVDVSDPRHPRVRGELKIPGYSSYLHPIGDGLLLGVGAEATEEGRRQGFQASVFDVSDPAAPKRLQHFVVPGAYSPSEFDHHAFLYWPQTGLTVLPLNRFPSEGDPGFQGAVGLRVGRDRLQEVGRIQHPEQPGQGDQPAYRPSIARTLVIGDRLYTVSNAGVLQSNLTTLADRTWVSFG